MPPRQDNDRIIAALTAHNVRFVLIGGLAAILQGSPFPTEDLDITPEREHDNLSRLSDALRELEARVFTQTEPDGLPFDHSATSLADSGVWNLVTSAGRLDISFIPNGTQGFPDLDRSALEYTVEGVSIRVASLADIIRSKQAANRPKDQRVLPTLREILASRHEKNRR
ncbi:MAG: hypothetical protein QM611_11515 [Microbacterium sp.]|uniref:nucleotidyltransferase domain-containing protein n=1 Tax=Microbacterium sp. TaxID=51671 RepID=UPI0039E69229